MILQVRRVPVRVAFRTTPPHLKPLSWMAMRNLAYLNSHQLRSIYLDLPNVKKIVPFHAKILPKGSIFTYPEYPGIYLWRPQNFSHRPWNNHKVPPHHHPPSLRGFETRFMSPLNIRWPSIWSLYRWSHMEWPTYSQKRPVRLGNLTKQMEPSHIHIFIASMQLVIVSLKTSS